MKLRVFVVMPYGRKEARAAVYSAEGRLEQPAIVVDFNAVYQKLIRPALERADCEPFRDDEGPGAGDIRTDIFFELVTADFVLADVSILNPNVFYELRRVIQAATNKSESFNRFVQWLFFGGEGLIAENDRDQQRKLIKYNHLIANCLIFHNVQAQTRVLRQFAEEGHEFDEATLSRLSPYLTEHVNRFGKYTLNLDRENPVPDYTLSHRPMPPIPQPVLARASL